jgi:glycosyltransferase involved in cell wall biosynthesis
LSIGGCQINAIDLAAEMRELGHEAIVYARPGPLESYIIEEKGLRFVRANDMGPRPAPTRIREVYNLVRREGIDLIHAYEWPPCLEAFYGAHLFNRTPLVCTVLSMSLMPLIPQTVPLLLGTAEMAEDARNARGGSVGVAEPPVDTERDHPGIDGRTFRLELGIGDEELAVVSVSRLAMDLKLDALVDAIDAIELLADRFPVRLVLVGAGDAEDPLRRRAEAVNARVGREVVLLPGSRFDPRPAYAAADVMVGMGSSALRAMAHGRPVIVQGERGFSRTFERASADQFLWAGFYGIGDGGSGAVPLAEQLEALFLDPGRRQSLGRAGRELVVERFGLKTAARNLIEVYEQATIRPQLPALWREAARVGRRAVANEGRLHLPSVKRARDSHDRSRLETAAATPVG